MTYTGELDGVTVNSKAKCDFNLILDHIPNCRYFYFGYDSKLGSADICVDDLMIYDRILSYEDVSALYTMETRVFDFDQLALGIDDPIAYFQQGKNNGRIYNLQGQRVANPTKGIYIKDGKKHVFK